MADELTHDEEQNLVLTIKQKRAMWAVEHSNRRIKTEGMRRLIKGEQTQIAVQDAMGRTKRKVKIPLSFAILETLAQFFGSTPSSIDIEPPPGYHDNPEEIIKAQQRENVIRMWMRENHFDAEFSIFGKTSSWFGTGCFRMTDFQGIPMVQAIERPENVIFGWKSDDFKELEYVIFEYFLSPWQVKKEYNVDVKLNAKGEIERNKSLLPGGGRWNIAGRRTDHSEVFGADGKTPVSEYVPKGFVKVQLYIDDEIECVVVNEGHIKNYVRHNYGFVPFYPFRNIIMPGEPTGESDYVAATDLEEHFIHQLDLLNEGAAENMKQVWVTNSMKVKKEDLKTDETNRNLLIKLDSKRNEEFKNVSPTTKVDLAQLAENANITKNLIHQFSFFPEQLFFAADIPSSLSGKAIRMIYSRITNLIKSKRMALEPVLDSMIRDAVHIMRTRGPQEMRVLFDEEFTNPIIFQWGELLPEEKSTLISNAVTAKNSGLISTYTARKMIGSSDPSFEDFMIRVEKSQEMLAQEQQQEMGIVPGPGNGQQPGPVGVPGERIPSEEAGEMGGEGIPASEGEPGSSAVISPQGQARQVAQHQSEQVRT